MTKNACRICGNAEGNKSFQAKEMALGLGDVFEYIECSRCGCLQIAEIPGDMGKYYPSDYYSIRRSGLLSNIKRPLITSRDRYALLGEGLIGRVLNALSPNAGLELISKKAVLRKSSRILDVGCGTGSLLRSLKELGFTDLAGADPYADTVDEPGLKIFKKDLMEMDEGKKFDLILFNHSLEHIGDQLGTMTKAKKLLAEGGTIVVRIPVKSDYIWKRYGTAWVQLDAPRHFFLHTKKSFSMLAEKAGLRVEEVVFDSNEFQFIGSEAYTKGIPLKKIEGELSPKGKFLNWPKIKRLRAMAEKLNAEEQGDQATFILGLPKTTGPGARPG